MALYTLGRPLIREIKLNAFFKIPLADGPIL